MSDSSSPTGERVVVLGLGNLLRGDEGLGIRALEQLQARYILPENVLLIDGGTAGLNLLFYLEEADLVLVLDAALTDGPPGTIWRASGDEVPAFFSMRTSPHEVALPDLLALMRFRETGPRELVVLGMQPGTIALGWELSEAVSAHLHELADAAANELRRWGLDVAPQAKVPLSSRSSH